MHGAANTSTAESREQTVKLLAELFPGEALRNISICLWDGTMWPDDSPRAVTLKLNHPGALRTMLLPGTEVALAEAYLFDDIDIVGDSEAIYELGEVLQWNTGHWQKKLSISRGLLALPKIQKPRETRHGAAHLTGKPHSIERDRQAIAYHYDVSNDFYSLFLDRHMVYSCAYFRRADDSLDVAQEQKLDYLCKKLRLKPGMRLLDIGCGWGGLVIYAAERYGVHATGITLSRQQVNYANQRIADAGLSDRARVLMKDYREMEAEDGFYDALVSVGMFEHVGEKLLPTYFTQAYRLVKPGGVFLNHGVARQTGDPGRLAYSFSNAYVFPDGELLPISQSLKAAEEAGFEVRDVESLREHYALTLRHWVRNLEAHHDQALAFVDEPTYRVWRVAMSYPAHMHSSGMMNLYQTLFVRPDATGASHLPLTREDWY